LLTKEGLSVCVINARFASPVDRKLFMELGGKIKRIFTVEEAVVSGGFGAAVSEVLDAAVVRIGLPDEFIPHGKRDLLLRDYGLTAEGLAQKIKACLK
jgi:1-deoxy-D-xylulose-5-phosphate synthase